MVRMGPENTTDDSTHDDLANETLAAWDFEGSAMNHTPVFAVVSAVADATGEDPLDLPPLARTIDPEALNDLFVSRPNAGIDSVSFEYYGYSVRVNSDGTVQITSAGRN